MKLQQLHQRVAAVCPIDGVASDKTIAFRPEAAAQQRLDAQAIADAFDLNAPPTLAERIKTAIAKIDQDTDAIIRDVIGERGNEYKLAEEEAKSFKAAGYAGTVPASVKSWADAKGWTATVACDDILATAAGWLNAQSSIRSNRLARKEEARKATTAAGVDTALASWATFVAQVRTSLGV